MNIYLCIFFYLSVTKESLSLRFSGNQEVLSAHLLIPQCALFVWDKQKKERMKKKRGNWEKPTEKGRERERAGEEEREQDTEGEREERKRKREVYTQEGEREGEFMECCDVISLVIPHTYTHTHTQTHTLTHTRTKTRRNHKLSLPLSLALPSSVCSLGCGNRCLHPTVSTSYFKNKPFLLCHVFPR